MHPATYKAFMRGLRTTAERVTVLTRNPAQRIMHIVWSNKIPVVFFQNGHEWTGLSEAGDPYIFCVNFFHKS